MSEIILCDVCGKHIEDGENDSGSHRMLRLQKKNRKQSKRFIRILLEEMGYDGVSGFVKRSHIDVHDKCLKNAIKYAVNQRQDNV